MNDAAFLGMQRAPPAPVLQPGHRFHQVRDDLRQFVLDQFGATNMHE
eukprot:COSAG02_NODE_34155_length_488_cov_7.804627_2_plen_47_part_00